MSACTSGIKQKFFRNGSFFILANTPFGVVRRMEENSRPDMKGGKGLRPSGRKDWYVQVCEGGKRYRCGCEEKVNRQRIGTRAFIPLPWKVSVERPVGISGIVSKSEKTKRATDSSVTPCFSLAVPAGFEPVFSP